MAALMLEAAFRSLLMAFAVWACVGLLRVRAVQGQKVAWVLVLLAAATMPLVMQAPWLGQALEATGIEALRIPIRPVLRRQASQSNAVSASGLNRPGLSTDAMRGDVREDKGNSMLSERTIEEKPKASDGVRGSILAGPKKSEGNSGFPAGSTERKATALDSTGGSRSKSRSSVPHNFGLNWPQIRTAITIAYFIGVGLLLLRMLIGLAIAYRIWRRSEPVPLEAMRTAGAGFLAVETADSTRVRCSRDLDTPVTIGSTVILPADCALWDEAKLRVVLAHERSHVRQRDFYLQVLAAVHAAFFWFSPLGWWLQRKLAELGEALGDRAGLEQAASPASYAQILLEFAATPRSNRFTNPLADTLAGPLTGVAMARSSNLSSRIERILNGRRFRLAFLGGRRHAVLAAVLVPALLVAVVACIRIVPAVEAGQGSAPAGGQSMAPAAGQDKPAASADEQDSKEQPAAPAGQSSDSSSDGSKVAVTGETQGQMSGEMPEQVTSTESDDSAQHVVSFQDQPASGSTTGSSAPAAAVAGQASVIPDGNSNGASVPEWPSKPGAGFAYAFSDSDEEPFVIVGGDNSTITMSGQAGKDLQKARAKVHGNFIWFKRDGQSYVVTDPAIVARGQSLFKKDESLGRLQAQLEAKQLILDKKMADLQPKIVKDSQLGPEFAQKMAKLTQELSELQSDKYKGLSEQIAKAVNSKEKVTDEMIREITEEKLDDLQSKIGDIQGRIGEIEGSIGERDGLLGEKQGKIGEEMGKLGEQMGKLGEEQGKKAEEATRKMKSILDQAVRDGKAKPVE